MRISDWSSDVCSSDLCFQAWNRRQGRCRASAPAQGQQLLVSSAGTPFHPLHGRAKLNGKRTSALPSGLSPPPGLYTRGHERPARPVVIPSHIPPVAGVPSCRQLWGDPWLSLVVPNDHTTSRPRQFEKNEWVPRNFAQKTEK